LRRVDFDGDVVRLDPEDGGRADGSEHARTLAPGTPPA
jgi:hypothetical protein